MNIRIYGAIIILCAIVSSPTLASDRYVFIVSKPLKTLTVPVFVGTAPITHGILSGSPCIKLTRITRNDSERYNRRWEFLLCHGNNEKGGIAIFSTAENEDTIPSGRYYPALVYINAALGDNTIPLDRTGVKGDGFTVPPLVTVRLQLLTNKRYPDYGDAVLEITSKTLQGYRYCVPAKPTHDGYECEWDLAVPNHDYMFTLSKLNASRRPLITTTTFSLRSAAAGVVKLEGFAEKE